MERYWLVAASFCFLLSFGHTLFALGAGTFRPARFIFTMMACGIVCQTVFLYLRSRQVHACPLTNLGATDSRLILIGFVFLTFAYMAGLAAGTPVSGLKTGSSLGIWAVYGTLLVMSRLRLAPAKRFARSSVVIFLVALVTLPGIHDLSLPHAP